MDEVGYYKKKENIKCECHRVNKAAYDKLAIICAHIKAPYVPKA